MFLEMNSKWTSQGGNFFVCHTWSDVMDTVTDNSFTTDKKEVFSLGFSLTSGSNIQVYLSEGDSGRTLTNSATIGLSQTQMWTKEDLGGGWRKKETFLFRWPPLNRTTMGIDSADIQEYSYLHTPSLEWQLLPHIAYPGNSGASQSGPADSRAGWGRTAHS